MSREKNPFGEKITHTFTWEIKLQSDSNCLLIYFLMDHNSVIQKGQAKQFEMAHIYV